LAAGYYNGTVRSWKLPATMPPEPGWAEQYVGREDGHREGITAVAVTPDGKTVATASADRTVRLWELATGKALRSLAGTGVVTAPAGTVMATTDDDSHICLREVSSGKLLHRFPGYHPAFAPDGKLLACVSEAEGQPWASGYYDIVLRDAATGAEVRRLRGHPGAIHCLTFSADGQVLASGAAGQRRQGKNVDKAPKVVDTIRLWDVATGKVMHQFGGDQHSVYALAFTPDGRSLVSGSYTTGGYKEGRDPDAPARVWETATGRERVHLVGHQGWVTSVAVSPDGRTVAAGGLDHSVRLWDILTGKEVRRYMGHREMVTAVTFAPGGKALVSGSSDTTALVWTMPGPTAPPARSLTAPELEGLWADLAGEDVARAYRAIAMLASAPAHSVPLLGKRLRPVCPAGEEAARLIDELGSDDFDVRDGAARQLAELGEGAAAALRKAVGNRPSLEARRRVEQLLAKIDAEGLRATRAVEVLERLGSPEAITLLENLSKGMPDARLTREAKTSLHRLARRAAAMP
jgi:dipeptidyl aminopeptidase/acylaminoacyl peptidase